MFCPKVPGGSESSRCLVGCGGVAVAQILKYWGYEVIPQGYISYISYIKDYDGHTHPTPISVNFAQQNYLWARMNNHSPNTHNALLLYHAAVAVRSDFGPSGTLSVTYNTKNALINFFGLNATLKSKGTYDYNSWVNLLKNQIDLNQPLMYRSNDGDKGHIWVIDGYFNNFFYCNWGWGGDSNGWFLLNALGPQNYNFDSAHMAIINIYPQSCNETLIENATISGNANYHNCSLKVRNTVIQNSSSVIFEADKTTEIQGPFKVKLGGTLEVK